MKILMSNTLDHSAKLCETLLAWVNTSWRDELIHNTSLPPTYSACYLFPWMPKYTVIKGSIIDTAKLVLQKINEINTEERHWCMLTHQTPSLVYLLPTQVPCDCVGSHSFFGRPFEVCFIDNITWTECNIKQMLSFGVAGWVITLNNILAYF